MFIFFHYEQRRECVVVDVLVWFKWHDLSSIYISCIFYFFSHTSFFLCPPLLHMITLSALRNPFIASETHFPQSKSSICIAQHELYVHSTSKSILMDFSSTQCSRKEPWMLGLISTLHCFFGTLRSRFLFSPRERAPTWPIVSPFKIYLQIRNFPLSLNQVHRELGFGRGDT